MQRKKPHGKRPESSSLFSIWGAESPRQTKTWTSVCIASDHAAAEVLQDRLGRLLSGEESNPRVRNYIASHWAHIVYYIYHLALNNTRVTLRDGLKKLEDLVRQFSNHSSSFGPG